MTTEAQRRARLKHQERMVVQLSIKLNRNTDADILEWLAHQDNKQGIIKELIRNHIKA